MAVVPDFSDSIKSVQAQPDWQTDIPSEEETEFGDFVLPIPDQDQSVSYTHLRAHETGRNIEIRHMCFEQTVFFRDTGSDCQYDADSFL